MSIKSRRTPRRVILCVALAVAAVVVVKLVLAIAGFAIGLAFFVLLTAGPVALVGWVLVKAFRRFVEAGPES